MRSLTFSGVALVALMTAQPALAGIDSGVGAPPPPPAVTHAMPATAMPAPPPPPVTADGRWMGGHAAPGGWNAYRAPAYGYQLPQYWMAPNFYMADYRAYGLPRPAVGYGWSRYYDDAVLTDQWGRVYDARSHYDWDRRGEPRGDGRGRSNSHDGDAAVAGIGGAAVGAVAGNLIAGAGSRLAGSLIGGGVGALAGLAIEAATNKHQREHRDYDDRDFGRDNGYDRDGYRGHGAHWGGGYNQGWAYAGGGETVTTTTVVTHGGCNCGVAVPRQVVTYENVYAAAPAAVHSKMKERRTTKLRPRVRGDY